MVPQPILGHLAESSFGTHVVCVLLLWLVVSLPVEEVSREPFLIFFNENTLLCITGMDYIAFEPCHSIANGHHSYMFEKGKPSSINRHHCLTFVVSSNSQQPAAATNTISSLQTRPT
jgi:hypothetical protein